MVKVDPEKCITCGLCADTAPEVFEMINDKAVVKAGKEGESSDKVKEAITNCPASAISE
jgi:ferredoxin